jgi:acylphosphatase
MGKARLLWDGDVSAVKRGLTKRVDNMKKRLSRRQFSVTVILGLDKQEINRKRLTKKEKK